MSLSQASIEFFKQEAKRRHTSYQGMIRRLLDFYAARHDQPVTARSGARSTRHRAA